MLLFLSQFCKFTVKDILVLIVFRIYDWNFLFLLEIFSAAFGMGLIQITILL